MTDKITFITGGSRGLGRSMALKLAAQGIGVVFTYAGNKQAAETTLAEIEAQGGTAAALQLDQTDPAQIASLPDRLRTTLRETFGRDTIDHLVNNAGTGHWALFADTTEDQLDDLYAVHVKGPFLLTQALLPMIEDGGKIVMISSGLARFALPGYSAYAAMKGAVEVLTRYLAKELGARGISVNTVAPGAIETDFGGGTVRDNPEVNQMVADHTALGRAGLPDDIGGAVAALLAGETHWITAQRIEVSGGQSI
ncbi:SDR family NAD(P)-dependent oxidoreductase [Roseovarius indicus]|uniref:SDR family NAD(P)-dependent oxidoreductase n=1 Tax=Roseovarius indicus TaxID=540747 RepID=UPI0032EFB121